jgi:hypothetical protein
MKSAAVLLCFLLALAACGAGATTPPAEVAVPAASAAPSGAASTAAVPAGPARRIASDEVRRRWPFATQPRFVLYADLGGLLHTELGRMFVPAVLQLSAGSLTEEQSRCLRGATEGVREIAMGVDEDDGVFIARFDEQAFDVRRCLAAAGASPVQVEGAHEAFSMKEGVVVHEPGLLLAGREKLVKDALHREGPSASFPAALSLGPDEYVAWAAKVDIGEDVRAQGTVLASSERFRLGVSADLPGPLAARVERELKAAREMGGIPGLEGPEKELATKLLRSVELTRDGGHIEGAFDLHEGPSEQARDLGAMAALGIAGVRKYIGNAKTAEARNTVGQIAKDYAAWWEREDGKPRAKKKLVSFPPVPKTVPRGAKYQSSPADWKPWAPLLFSMDQPQYYQYEVRAAKNGESAEILARGDLDGDGKTSLFKVQVHIDRAKGDAFVVAPNIEETDPEE